MCRKGTHLPVKKTSLFIYFYELGINVTQQLQIELTN